MLTVLLIVLVQACMEGYQVTTLADCLETADIFVTTTGNKDIIMATDMAKMKNNAIVGNIGHFDNEIDMAGLYAWQGKSCWGVNQKYQTVHITASIAEAFSCITT